MHEEGVIRLLLAMVRTCPNLKPPASPDALAAAERRQYLATGRVNCGRCLVAKLMGRSCLEAKSGGLSTPR